MDSAAAVVAAAAAGALLLFDFHRTGSAAAEAAVERLADALRS